MITRKFYEKLADKIADKLNAKHDDTPQFYCDEKFDAIKEAIDAIRPKLTETQRYEAFETLGELIGYNYIFVTEREMQEQYAAVKVRKLLERALPYLERIGESGRPCQGGEDRYNQIDFHDFAAEVRAALGK